MNVTLSKQGSELTARISGELDQHSAACVRERLDEAIRSGTVNRLVFDLDGLTFMDSSGVGVILGRYRELSKRRGSINVVNAQRSVERVLRMSGVYKLCTERRSV